MGFGGLCPSLSGAGTSFGTSFGAEPDMADDLAQESFVQALAGLSRWRGDGAVLAWLRGIVRNQSRLQWRTLARQGRYERDGLAEFLEELALDEAGGHSEIEVSERLAVLERCLQGLDDRGRKLLELRHQHDLSCEEIAKL